MRRWRILMIVASIGAVLWWTNSIVTRLHPPFDSPVSGALWVLASMCKIVTILGLAWAIGRVALRCYRNPRNTAIAAATWMTAGLLLLMALTLMRAPIAHTLNNDEVRFFPTAIVKGNQGGFWAADDYPECVRRWQSGKTFAEEAGVVVFCSAGLALLGLLVGRHGTKAGVVGLLSLGVFAILVIPKLGLMSWDYDYFISGTMIGPLSLEAMAPYAAGSLPTEIGFLVYLGIIGSSWALDSRLIALTHKRVQQYPR